MINLALAALFLPLSHFLLSSSALRTMLVRRLGEVSFTLAYSVVTLIAFAWLIIAYRHAPMVVLWVAPVWMKVVLLPVMLAASVLAVAGLTTPNPSIVGSGGLLERPDIVRGTLRVTRNPFFWGAGLFAVGHAVAAGHLPAVLAFGSVAFLSLAGASVLDAKKARRHGCRWDAYAAATSNMPFMAILQGRQTFAWREIGLWRIALAAGLFVAALLFHQTLFGGSFDLGPRPPG
jgi:uncharacterized membrane protein